VSRKQLKQHRALLTGLPSNESINPLSIGVVTWDTPPHSVDEMHRAADHLMNAIRHKSSNAPANAA